MDPTATLFDLLMACEDSKACDNENDLIEANHEISQIANDLNVWLVGGGFAPDAKEPSEGQIQKWLGEYYETEKWEISAILHIPDARKDHRFVTYLTVWED